MLQAFSDSALSAAPLKNHTPTAENLTVTTDPAAPEPTPDSSQPLPTPRSSFTSVDQIYNGLAFLLVALVGWFYVRVIDTQNMGFIHDDGVYAIVGKALATGKGFTLLHVVGQPAQIKYPFVYPAILSLVWLFNPHFPENLPALNYITIAFTLGACGLIYLYLKRAKQFPGWLALLVVILTTAHFFFMYFFSTVMSEGPYLFFSMLTLWMAYKATQDGSALTPKALGSLIVLSSITFLTRIPGVTMMGAIGVWLLLQGQWKNALRYGLGCFCFGILPWMLWVKCQTPTITPMNYPLVNTYSNYGLEFFHNLRGANYLATLPGDLMSLMFALLGQLFPVIPNFKTAYPKLMNDSYITASVAIATVIGLYGTLGYYLMQCIQTLLRSIKQGLTKIQAQSFSISGLYLFFYILMITLWNYEDQMSRFLTAVTPLLWLYFFKPWVSSLPEFGRAWPAQRIRAGLALTGVILTATLSLWLAPSSYKTVYTSRNQHWVDSGRYRWMWHEYQQVFAWIKQTLPSNASLAVNSDAVFYLYTNRPTFYIFFASLRKVNGQFTKDSIPLLMQSLDAHHIQYLVAEPHMTARVIRKPVNEVARQLLEAFPNRFEPVYSSPNGAINIYKIVPD